MIITAKTAVLYCVKKDMISSIRKIHVFQVVIVLASVVPLFNLRLLLRKREPNGVSKMTRLFQLWPCLHRSASWARPVFLNLFLAGVHFRKPQIFVAPLKKAIMKYLKCH